MDFKERYISAWSKAWDFHKRYASSENKTEAFWEQLVNEAEEVVKSFKDRTEHDFVRDLILAVLSEIERVDKRQRQQQENNENEKK